MEEKDKKWAKNSFFLRLLKNLVIYFFECINEIWSRIFKLAVSPKQIDEIPLLMQILNN